MKYFIFIICLVMIFTGCKDFTELEFDDEVIEVQYGNASRTTKILKMENTFTRETIELPDGLIYTDYFYHNDEIYFVCGNKLVVGGEVIELPDLIDVLITTNGDYIIYNGEEIIKLNSKLEAIKSLKVNIDGEYIDFLTDKFERFYLFTTKSVTMLSAEGNVIFDMNITGELKGVHQFPDEKILLNIDNSYVFLDVNNHTLDRTIRLPKVPYDYEILMGNDYELYFLANDLTVYGYLEREVVPIEVMDLINSNINFFDIADLKILSQDKMFFDTHDNKIVLLNRTDPNTITQKKPINLASYGYDSELIDLIIDFNVFNKIYHINLIDCSIYKLADIQADIYIGSDNLDINALTVKGELYNLNPLMAIDEQLAHKHVLNCVVEPFTYNGEFYSLSPSFSIQAFAGKTENIGARSNILWTLPYLVSISSEYTRIISNIRPIDFLKLIISGDLYNYLNDPIGFKHLEFYSSLEFSRYIGTEIYNRGLYNGDNSGFKNNTTLLYHFIFNQPDDYLILPEMFGTADITLKGVPSYGGNTGLFIEPVRRFAISRHSESVEGAWDFIKILMNEYQADGYFSSLIEDFDNQITSSKLTQADKDYISALIKDCHPMHISANNEDIFDMIEVPVLIYYENARPIDYITDLITSRVYRYLAGNNIY